MKKKIVALIMILVPSLQLFGIEFTKYTFSMSTATISINFPDDMVLGYFNFPDEEAIPGICGFYYEPMDSWKMIIYPRSRATKAPDNIDELCFSEKGQLKISVINNGQFENYVIIIHDKIFITFNGVTTENKPIVDKIIQSIEVEPLTEKNEVTVYEVFRPLKIENRAIDDKDFFVVTPTFVE